MSKMKLMVAALSSALMFGAAAQQQDQQDVQIEPVQGQEHAQQQAHEFGPMTAENVLNKLYQSSVKEAAFGQLAADKGSSSRVRDFGERLVEDHKAAASRVKEVARAQNVEIHELSVDDDFEVGEHDEADELETTESQGERRALEQDIASAPMDQKQQAKMAKEEFRTHYQRLHTLEDEEFDEAFLSMMEKEHDMLLNKLEKAEGQVDNEQVKQLIAETRPILTEHQQMAQRIQSELETAQRPGVEGQTQQN